MVCVDSRPPILVGQLEKGNWELLDMTRYQQIAIRKRDSGVTLANVTGYNQSRFSMRVRYPNSNLPICWLHCLVCPRRHLAVLPSQARPNLFGSD